MPYTDVDWKAINTIRVLAVRIPQGIDEIFADLRARWMLPTMPTLGTPARLWAALPSLMSFLTSS